MLARSGPIPTRGNYAFEVKWDGFRALVSTDPFRIRSRRGWDMTPLLSEFADLRPNGIYDAELVAFGEDGRPDFPDVCERLLHRDSTIPLALIVFDVLAYRGRSLIGEPYRKRRGAHRVPRLPAAAYEQRFMGTASPRPELAAPHHVALAGQAGSADTGCRAP